MNFIRYNVFVLKIFKKHEKVGGIMKKYFKTIVKSISILLFVTCFWLNINVSATADENYSNSNEYISLTAYQISTSSISYQVEYTDEYSDFINSNPYAGILHVAIYDSNGVLVDAKIADDNNIFENVLPGNSYTVKSFVFDELTQMPLCGCVGAELYMDADFTDDNLYTSDFGVISASTFAYNDFYCVNFITRIIGANERAKIFHFAKQLEINNPPSELCEILQIQPANNTIIISEDSYTDYPAKYNVMNAFKVLEGYLLKFDSVSSYIYKITCSGYNSDFSFVGESNNAVYTATDNILRLDGETPAEIQVSDSDLMLNLGSADDNMTHGEPLSYSELFQNCWAGTGADMVDFSGSAAVYQFLENGSMRNIILVYNFDNPNKPELEYEIISGIVDDIVLTGGGYQEAIPCIKLENEDIFFEVYDSFVIVNPTEKICQITGKSGSEITVNLYDYSNSEMQEITNEFLSKNVTLKCRMGYIFEITL